MASLADKLSKVPEDPAITALKAKKAELEERREKRRLAEEIQELEEELAQAEKGELVLAEMEQLPKVTVTVDLAPFTDRIVLDGREFFHGMTYTVRPDVAAQLANMCDL